MVCTVNGLPIMPDPMMELMKLKLAPATELVFLLESCVTVVSTSYVDKITKHL